MRCRTQEELKEGISPEVVLQRELEFFNNHAELSRLPNEYKGMPALVDKLVKLQGLRIHSHLPVLKKQVSCCSLGKACNFLCFKTYQQGAARTLHIIAQFAVCSLTTLVHQHYCAAQAA